MKPINQKNNYGWMAISLSPSYIQSEITALNDMQNSYYLLQNSEHALSAGRNHIVSNDLLNELIRSINYSKTSNELFVLVERTIYDFDDLMNPGHSTNTKSEIQNALVYIEENYAQHLTLAKVARHVYLSNSRFSTLFAEEMKEPFSKYLTNKRIQKAKELMKNPYAKIDEISYAVGFQDARYFSAVFKKSTSIPYLIGYCNNRVSSYLNYKLIDYLMK